MHNHSKHCHLISFSPIMEMPQAEAEFLDEYFDVVAINYTDDGLEEYVGYKSPTFDSAHFLSLVQKKHLNLPQFTATILEDKNWLKENVIKFSPFEIGDFMIYGIHENSQPQTKKIPVQVYAATAFGSEHQTTKMCLTAITELHAKIATPQKILDMGTGSGILSIAGAKIWQKIPTVISADIDPESVDVTANNAITNDVEGCITSILSDGYQNPTIAQNAPYDLIFANILANPLKLMSQSAYNSLKKTGYYLISGFIDNQESDIIKHHEAVGFKIIKIYQNENWRSVLMQK